MRAYFPPTIYFKNPHYIVSQSNTKEKQMINKCFKVLKEFSKVSSLVFKKSDVDIQPDSQQFFL